MLLNQARKIQRSSFKPKVVIVITRGGWIPARVLSDFLGVYDLAITEVKFYLGVAITRDEPFLTWDVPAIVAGKKTFLADDIADTGKSLPLALDYLEQRDVSEVRTATVYRKPLSVITPDCCEKIARFWAVFPWDTKVTIRKILKKNVRVNVNAGKLEKAGLPKQLVREVLKEMFEDENC